jgi:hypothetical protein
MLCVGYRTRLAAALVWLLVLSFQRRDPWVLNSGDFLIRDLALVLMLAPSGTSLSVDRWRTARDRFWEFPSRAPWPLRLMQIQLCVLYFTSVWDKVRGTTWNNGTAVSYALRLSDLTRFSTPAWFNNSELLANLLTFGTLAIEAGLVVLVWNRRTRPWILALGIAMHLGIELTIEIGFFSLAVITAYLVWVPPVTMRNVVLRLRDRVRERLAPRVRSRPPATAV